MFLLEDLQETISRGESPYVEFKETLPKPNDLAAEIVAFANSEGGLIFLGVDDQGKIAGIATEQIEERIINICRNNCIPPITPFFQQVTLENQQIAVLSISKGHNRLYCTSEGKYYIRAGTTKRIASREELMRLFQASGTVHYDISAVPGTTKKDLNLSQIRDYFLSYNAFDLFEESDETVENILTNADILADRPGRECTVGGLLIFGNNPSDKITSAGIDFAHFNGDQITEDLVDKKVLTGNLPGLVEQALVVLSANIKTPSTLVGAKRVDKKTYPRPVLREALVNALIHRNYSISGSLIRVLMFSNRLEFHSPGRLPNTVTIEKMKIGVSYARNPFLVKYMENLRYADRLGRGIPMILRSMRDLGAPEPELKELGEEFVLTIFAP